MVLRLLSGAVWSPHFLYCRRQRRTATGDRSASQSTSASDDQTAQLTASQHALGERRLHRRWSHVVLGDQLSSSAVGARAGRLRHAREEERIRSNRLVQPSPLPFPLRGTANAAPPEQSVQLTARTQRRWGDCRPGGHACRASPRPAGRTSRAGSTLSEARPTSLPPSRQAG